MTEARELVPVVHNTDLIVLPQQTAPSPTEEIYGEFQAAYNFLNRRLFANQLPRCLITLQRHSLAVMGYHSPDRFVSNRDDGTTTDEIALNPIHFKGRDATEVLQTLGHEMCHEWQWHFGKPSRRGYHNKEWAAKMKSIGLQPSSTGKPGGDEVGQHMGDYVIEGGAFDLTVQELLRNRFRISWYDRFAELLEMMQQEPNPSGTSNPSAETVAPIRPRHVQRPGRRQKFTCPKCELSAWAKPSAKLKCLECDAVLLPHRPGISNGHSNASSPVAANCFAQNTGPPTPRYTEGNVAMTQLYAAFQQHTLFDRFSFFSGRLPPELDRAGREKFDDLWKLHPEQSNEILIHGRMVAIPRWQQAFGQDYHFSGTVNEALPVPDLLAPFLAWVRDAVDPRLNGLLLNWYAADRGHYIGAHRDSRKGLVEGSPIVTISLGEERTFRLRLPGARGFADFPATHGTVFVMPWETNLGVKHEVPHTARATGGRISITARAFEDVS